jgi:predicted lipoprotein with Yx(FWY)xxD motif
VVALVAATVLLGACGSSATSSADGPATTATSVSVSTAVSDQTTATSLPGGTVDATFPPNTATINSTTSALGTILVDGTGHTLYVYLPDSAGGVPTCLADCAKVWPPVTGGFLGVATAVPLTPHEFKLVAIPGQSTRQASVNGHPLYRFSGDRLAGELNGQGLDHQWYVVGSNGQPITRAAPATTTTKG